MTMMTRITSVITQLTWLGSAVAGKPLALSASLYLASSQPLSSMSPILVTTFSFGTVGSAVKVMPCLVRKSLTLSHSLNFDHGPTNMWNLHSSAATVIGVDATACSS